MLSRFYDKIWYRLDYLVLSHLCWIWACVSCAFFSRENGSCGRRV